MNQDVKDGLREFGVGALVVVFLLALFAAAIKILFFM